MLRERPKSLPAPRYILSRFLLPDIKDSQAQKLRVFFFACRRPDSEPSRSVGLRLTHFGHQRPAYGPGTDRARALYLDCCTCRSVRERGSRERREFAPDHVVKVASRRRGYGVRWINLGEEIYDATGQKRMTLPDRKVTVWV